jgi:hypothetical protein
MSPNLKATAVKTPQAYFRRRHQIEPTLMTVQNLLAWKVALIGVAAKHGRLDPVMVFVLAIGRGWQEYQRFISLSLV